MKLQLGRLINSLGNGNTGDLGAFYRFNQNPLPIKTSMRMRAIIRKVDEIVNDFNDARLELCKRFGTLNEETQNYDFEGKQGEAFNSEYADLMLSEIEIPGSRIPISQLLSSTVITPNDALALEWLIDDGRDAAEPKKAPAPQSDDDILELAELEDTKAATA